MKFRGTTINLLLAAGLASSFALAADPLQHSLRDGLFKRTEADAKDHPLPHYQRLEALVDSNSFKIRDGRNGSQFVYQVFGAIPGAQGAGLKALGEDIPQDGATLVAPVDLTGSGVSDIIYARKDWGGWKVLSNGTRLPKPFEGFVCGNYEKNQESAKSDIIPADTRDMVVDNDLLTTVGDFLGNGTEQLAYTRPGWNQIWVVGAHGVVQMTADLKGIETNGAGERVHWLFPFKSKGAQHTKIAYYRKGCTEMATFAPRGMTFKREQAPLKGNWEKLCQNVLDWPQPAPSQLEQKASQIGQKAEDIKGDIAKAAGMD
jgi:hypothetical protein